MAIEPSLYCFNTLRNDGEGMYSSNPIIFKSALEHKNQMISLGLSGYYNKLGTVEYESNKENGTYLQKSKMDIASISVFVATKMFNWPVFSSVFIGYDLVSESDIKIEKSYNNSVKSKKTQTIFHQLLDYNTNSMKIGYLI